MVACIVLEVLFQRLTPLPHLSNASLSTDKRRLDFSALSIEQIDVLEKRILSDFKTNPPPLALPPLARSVGGHYGWFAVRFRLDKCVLVYKYKCQCIRL